MCGIVGFTGFDDPGLLARMNETQRHRGPDDAGEYWDPAQRVGLAMRRLSIIDLAGGHQPMASGDGGTVLVFNGEIFNASELRRELEAQGVAFRTDHSDTEVVLRLYEAKGDAAPALLNGMFAFVVYDRRNGVLFGARDPFGIKPLYLHEHPAGLAWASELKALHGLPTFSRDLDPLAVEQYLGLQYVPGEMSVFHCVRKLRPGHCFRYDLATRQLSRRRYYELPFARSGLARRTVDHGELREQVQAAVVRWSLADVPIACSLSGGIDSGIVTASLARMGRTVRTYSLGFPHAADQDLDELAAAREIARLYGTDHHEMMIEADDLLEALPEMVWHLDEPYGGGLPSWYVFREMARDVRVGMTGVGGDELFTNYNKFRVLEDRDLFMMALRINERLPAVSALGSGISSLLTAVKSRLGREDEELTVRGIHERADARLFWLHPFGLSYPTAHGRGFNERVSATPHGCLSAGRAVLDATFREYAHLDFRDRCAAVDFNNQLPDEFLQMTDRFSMAHSLEARTPFLDKDLVRLVVGLDASVRFTPQQPKALLKAVFAPWLPPGHTTLKKKGFVLPHARWLRGRLRATAEDLFSPASLKRDGWVRSDFRDYYFRRFLEGDAQLTETIWTVFMFRLWEQYGIRCPRATCHTDPIST